MMDAPRDSHRRLLYLMHRAWVEARRLAASKDTTQLHELADICEPIPEYMVQWDDAILDLLRTEFGRYQAKYRDAGCDDFIAILDQPPPGHFK